MIFFFLVCVHKAPESQLVLACRCAFVFRFSSLIRIFQLIPGGECICILIFVIMVAGNESSGCS